MEGDALTKLIGRYAFFVSAYFLSIVQIYLERYRIGNETKLNILSKMR